MPMGKSARRGVIWLLVALLALLPPAEAKRKEEQPVRVVSDPEIADLLEELSAPLLKAAELPVGSVRFHVILDQELNAMALPNMQIAFNSGLLLAVESVDELAAVMAHELGHLAAGHHQQMQQALKGISIGSLIAAAAGIAAGVATGQGQIAGAAIVGSQAAGMTSLLAMSREKETQSDRLAVGYLAKAGFNPKGVGDFMQRINRQQRLSNRPPPYLTTHPVSSERVAEALDFAARTPSVSSRKGGDDGLRLARVRAKLEAGTIEDPWSAVERFSKRMQHQGGDFATRYGLAVAQRYAGQLPEAERQLTSLLKEGPGDPFLLRERGLTRLEAGRLPEAAEDLRAALQRKPKDPDLRYRLAFVLHQDGRLEEASRLLYRLSSEHPDEARVLHLLGGVEAQRHQNGESHLAFARYHRLVLDHPTALYHYQEAVAALTGSARKSAQAEYERFRKELRERERFSWFGGGKQ